MRLFELPPALRTGMKTRGWRRHEHSELFGDTLVLAQVLGTLVDQLGRETLFDFE